MILHLARRPPPPGVVADDDWLVTLPELEVVRGPEPGRIDYNVLVALIARADKVVTW